MYTTQENQIRKIQRQIQGKSPKARDINFFDENKTYPTSKISSYGVKFKVFKDNNNHTQDNDFFHSKGFQQGNGEDVEKKNLKISPKNKPISENVVGGNRNYYNINNNTSKKSKSNQINWQMGNHNNFFDFIEKKQKISEIFQESFELENQGAQESFLEIKNIHNILNSFSIKQHNSEDDSQINTQGQQQQQQGVKKIKSPINFKNKNTFQKPQKLDIKGSHIEYAGQKQQNNNNQQKQQMAKNQNNNEMTSTLESSGTCNQKEANLKGSWENYFQQRKKKIQNMNYMDNNSSTKSQFQQQQGQLQSNYQQEDGSQDTSSKNNKIYSQKIMPNKLFQFKNKENNVRNNNYQEETNLQKIEGVRQQAQTYQYLQQKYSPDKESNKQQNEQQPRIYKSSSANLLKKRNKYARPSPGHNSPSPESGTGMARSQIQNVVNFGTTQNTIINSYRGNTGYGKKLDNNFGNTQNAFKNQQKQQNLPSNNQYYYSKYINQNQDKQGINNNQQQQQQQKIAQTTIGFQGVVAKRAQFFSKTPSPSPQNQSTPTSQQLFFQQQQDQKMAQSQQQIHSRKNQIGFASRPKLRGRDQFSPMNTRYGTNNNSNSNQKGIGNLENNKLPLVVNNDF